MINIYMFAFQYKVKFKMPILLFLVLSDQMFWQHPNTIRKCHMPLP